MQRVVRRSEIESEHESQPDSTSEQDIAETLQHLGQLEFIEAEPKTQQNPSGNPDDDEVDFRLFAVAKSAATVAEAKALQRIRLRSPSVGTVNPGFVNAQRDPSYYFQKTPSDAVKKNFEASALNGDQIRRLAKSYRPGSAYEWKVLRLPATNLARSLRETQVSGFSKLLTNEESQPPKRPGKKARIKVRVKREVLRKQRIDNKAAAEAKDATEREKRTQRNREKKVKKKMRDKAKKAAEHVNDADELQSGPND